MIFLFNELIFFSLLFINMGNKQPKPLPTGLAPRRSKGKIPVDNSKLSFPILYEEFPKPPKFTLKKEHNLAEYDVKDVLVLKDGNILITTNNSQNMIVIFEKNTFIKIDSISDSKEIVFDIAQLDNFNIAALLSNGKIIIYSINTKQMTVLKEFKIVGGIMKKLLNNAIACYSIKKNQYDIRIYDLTSLSDTKERVIYWDFLIHSVLQPNSNKDVLVVAHSIRIITFYNIKKYVKIEKDIQWKEDFISPLYELNDGRIIIGGNATFMIINCKTYQVECFYEDLFCFENSSFLQLKDKSLLIGTGLSNAGRFCLLGSNLKVIARQKRVHKERIIYLSLIDDNTVLSFSLDKIVKIWSYK